MLAAASWTDSMTPLARETCEVVIRVRAKDRRGSPTEEQLQQQLRDLRKQGYEVDLYIRGCWRKLGGKPRSLPETFMQSWRVSGGLLHADCELASGQWVPAPKYQPRPEIVLRGVRMR